MDKKAEYIENIILKTFSKERILSTSEIQIAKFLEIRKYEDVKVVEMSKDKFRGMLNGEALILLNKLNLVKDTTNAITFGNKIFFFKSDDEKKTIAHELVHVFQYDRLGIEGFIKIYLKERSEGIESNKISLEIPACEFADDYVENGYSIDGIIRDKYKFLPKGFD